MCQFCLGIYYNGVYHFPDSDEELRELTTALNLPPSDQDMENLLSKFQDPQEQEYLEVGLAPNCVLEF